MACGSAQTRYLVGPGILLDILIGEETVEAMRLIMTGALNYHWPDAAATLLPCLAVFGGWGLSRFQCYF